MTSVNLGNKLNQIVGSSRAKMFEQGEFAQLTYKAFEIASQTLQSFENDKIEISVPVGYRPDKTTITSTWTYPKAELLSKYEFLASNQLSTNALVQLVTIVETLLGDLIRAVVLRYPQKLGSKRTIAIQAILEAASLEEIHLQAIDTFMNELVYKSPSEFAESLQQLISVNLLECPAFHCYMEIKATRDIFIHNSGVANDIYVRKAGTHVRVKAGMILPSDTQYFLESYESCLKIVDWLEIELHGHWHSSEYEDRRNPQIELPIETL